MCTMKESFAVCAHNNDEMNYVKLQCNQVAMFVPSLQCCSGTGVSPDMYWMTHWTIYIYQYTIYSIILTQFQEKI